MTPLWFAKSLLKSRHALLLFGLVWLLLALPVHAADADGASPEFDVAAAKKAIAVMEKAHANSASDDEGLSLEIKSAVALRSDLSNCAKDAEAELAAINADLTAVEVAVGEPSKAADKELKPLRTRKSTLEGRLAECRLYLSRADKLVSDLTTMQSKRLAERLLHREADVSQLVMATLRDPAEWWNTAWDFVRDRSGLRELGVVWSSLGGVLLGLGVWTGRKVRPWLRQQLAARSGATRLSRVAAAVFQVVERRIASLLAVTLVTAYLVLLHQVWQQALSFVASASLAITGYAWARVCIRGLFTPPAPHESPLGLPDWLAKAVSLRLSFLLIGLAFGSLLFLTPLPEALPPHVQDLFRTGVVVLLALNAAWLVWLVGSIPGWSRGGRGARTLMLLVLVAVIVSELTGYHKLASYLFIGLSLTFGLLLLAWIFGALLQELFDSLDAGRYAWQQRLRRLLGMEAEESIPGLIWLRLILAALTWGFWLVLFARIWGLSDAGLAVVLKYLTDGIALGDVRFVPSQVLLGVTVFLLLSAIVRAVKRGVEQKVAVQRRMDVGAREALVKVVGYIGFLFAAFTALSVAGVSFANFAIVAGALSVGIGFGLQNIVNNFVSGLILLFERPIRTGDWIVVDGHEGIVKRISVRSTEIQTFDRGDVILPNADLLSNAVKNYTLRDRIGRVKCAVGVAYGTDTDEVKRILLEVANAHPRVIRGGIASAPWVWFRGFGDSSLNFEVVGFIMDVSERLTVESDLYFAIERRFREAKIEIPFPQRDINIRYADNKFREALEPPGAAEDEDDDDGDDFDGGSDSGN